MRTIRLLIIVLLLNACDNTSVTGVQNQADVYTLSEIEKLNKEGREYAAMLRDKSLQHFEPEELAKELFDLSKLECEKNGICKVKLSDSDDYAYFSVSDLISEKADYTRIVDIMNDRRRNGVLATGLREEQFFNDKKAMLDAAIEDSSRMSIVINQFEDLQGYYRDKTLQLNSEMIKSNRVN